MILKVKRVHPDSIIPKYATEGAACFDLHAVDIGGFTVAEHAVLKKAGMRADLAHVTNNDPLTFRTGLAFEVPPGYVMLIFSRSGQGFNFDTRLANCVGVIDSDYRGEVSVKLTADGENGGMQIRPGDRIAQAMLVPTPQVELVEYDNLTETARGEAGFGSTGV